ncbi:MAG: MFS transporter [Nitrospiraceae bacterium]
MLEQATPTLSGPNRTRLFGLALDQVDRDQRLILLVTWFSWTLGAMDTMIYSLVLTPALTELLASADSGSPVSTGTVGWYGGVILSTFLVGWAVGGVGLGSLADRLGRTRVMVLCMVVIAVSTGLATFAQAWWHLAGTRFFTGVGIGGLWAAGAALIAEVWPEHNRPQAAGFLQSAWGFGFFLAAALHLLVKGYGWRGFFALGFLTIVAAWLLTRRTHDSSRWQSSHAAEEQPGQLHPSRLRPLFRPDYRRATWSGTTLAFVAVFGLWGATNWTPSLIQALPDLAGLDPSTTASYVSYAVMSLNVGALLGYFGFGFLASRLGRKPVFALMSGGSLILVPVTFLFPHSYTVALCLLPILGFFTKGIFGGFPLYFPELFPTRLRSTGAGFCYNAGRIVASISPFMTGTLVSTFGSFGMAASTIAAIYLVALAILPFAIETHGRPLPE